MSVVQSQSNWREGLDPAVAPDLERSALVLIDLPVDFLDGGASPVAGTTEVLPAVIRLLDAYRAAALPVIHVIRIYEGDDVDLIRRASIAAGAPIVRAGSAGSQIAAELRPNGDELDDERLRTGELQSLGRTEHVMWKPRWSAFHRTTLHEHLTAASVNTVVIGGCNFPNCPRATITDASAHDYRVLVASDAISGVSELHLEEAERIGAVHAPADTIGAAVGVLRS